MQRIFLTSSHLSTAFITLYASSTRQPGCSDILIIDHTNKKETLTQHIKNTAKFHEWEQIIDLSIPVDDDRNLKPTRVKKLTRYLKCKPGFKQVYDVLYKKQKVQALKKQRSLFQASLKTSPDRETALYLLTETILNKALCKTFPDAKINFFEHGLTDYFFVVESKAFVSSLFYCIFADEFKAYLTRKKLENEFVIPYFNAAVFTNICQTFLNSKNEFRGINDLLKDENKYSLLLLQNLEIYNVGKDFWPEYFDLCLKQIPDPEKYTFLIKPHPNQSNEIIFTIGEYFKSKKLKYIVLTDPVFVNMGIEIVFSVLQKKTHYVFGPFSSAVFYLSQLFPASHITYYHSYSFMKKHLGRSPEQLKQLFLKHEELIKEVFSEKCKEIY